MRTIASFLLAITTIATVACSSGRTEPSTQPSVSEPTLDVPATVASGIKGTQAAEAAINATVEARVAATLTTPYPSATQWPTATAWPTATEYPTATPWPTNTPWPTALPWPTFTPYPTVTPRPTPTPRPTLTPVPTPRPRPTLTPRPMPIIVERTAKTFVIGEGSKITFTVEEELGRSPIRFDTVISSVELKGVANLDGQPSVVTLNLHSLKSDQQFRDQYIQNRMFAETLEATVTVDNLPDLPRGFFTGEETTGTIAGSLQIGYNVTPLIFDVVARHDGNVINVLGLTSFTWTQLGLTKPTARSVVYLGDEVRVQVLLVASAQ